MQQYQELIKRVMVPENLRGNRTGVNAYKTAGEAMFFDLTKGFPATTTKKLAFNQMKGEALGFFNAFTSAADFRAFGCKIWDANANQHGTKPNAWLSNPNRKGEDDLGPVYGAPWREWDGYKVLPCIEPSMPKEECERAEAIHKKLRDTGWTSLGHVMVDGVESYVMHKSIDQLGDCVRSIINDPEGRRILFHGWNPALLDEVALPSCHLLYQFVPDPVTRELNMIIYIRSNDIGLGTPFNIAEAAFIMHAIGRVTGYKPKKLSYFIGDAHIYENQVEYLTELLTKEPLPLPTLEISDEVWAWPTDGTDAIPVVREQLVEQAVAALKAMRPEHFSLANYLCHTLVTPVPEMVV